MQTAPNFIVIVMDVGFDDGNGMQNCCCCCGGGDGGEDELYAYVCVYVHIPH